MYASRIADPARRAAVIDAHVNTLRGIEGIYNVAEAKIKDGTATQKDYADRRKCRVLIALDNTDYQAFRLASRVMPYVIDIDEKDGGFYFATPEQAKVAAEAEEQYIELLQDPRTTEATLDGWFKKFVKSIAQPFKAAGNAVVSATKSAVNATKAAVNVTKGTVQLVTGNTSAAKDSFKKAGSQMKDAVVDPVKQTYDDIKEGVKINADLTKQTISIGGKVLKVLFIKINPVTVLIRNCLRGLLRLNFAGMATRFNVGLLTEKEAADLGYDSKTWQKAKRAMERAKKLFKSMGGNPDKFEKAIRNGSKLPVAKLDKNTKLNIPDNSTDDGDASLGWIATASAVAACIGVLISLWKMVYDIVAAKKAAKLAEEQQKAQAEADKERQEEQAAQIAQMKEIYAVDANGNFLMDVNGNYILWDTYWADQKAAQEAAEAEVEGGSNKKYIIIAAVGGLALVGIAAAAMGGGSGKKKDKR